MSKVFISYNHADRAFVSILIADLRIFGVDVWWDQWELKVGDSIIEKINEGLSENDYLIIVLSKDSVKSAWVQRELSAALYRELEERNVVVMPVVIDKSPIPPLIADKKYADFRHFPAHYTEGLLELFDALDVRITSKLRAELEESVDDKDLFSIMNGLDHKSLGLFLFIAFRDALALEKNDQRFRHSEGFLAIQEQKVGYEYDPSDTTLAGLIKAKLVSQLGREYKEFLDTYGRDHYRIDFGLTELGRLKIRKLIRKLGLL